MPAETAEKPLSVAIVGAGFSGIGMGIALRRAGIESFAIFERAESIGGVWHHNTYPGAACDVPSSLLLLLRAAQRLVAALLAAGGDPRLPAHDGILTWGRGPRSARHRDRLGALE